MTSEKEPEWTPDPAMTWPATRFVPLRMKRITERGLEYREPTAEEIQDYISSEAW